MHDHLLTVSQIASRVGFPVMTEDVDLLWGLARMIYEYPDQPVEFFDYADFQVQTSADDDLPAELVPTLSKKGRPEKAKRKFLRNFFNAVEYVQSEQITWREGAKHQNLTDDEKFEAFNQCGKIAFLIAREFYPDISIDGLADNPNDRGDVVAILQPKKTQRPFNATRQDVKDDARRKAELERKVLIAIKLWGEDAVKQKLAKFPVELQHVHQVLEKKKRL